MKELWKQTTYTNHNIPYLFNVPIIEYDMKDAGLSLSREYSLLDDNTIEKLLKMPKETQTVELGKLQRKDKVYADNLLEAFANARKLFIEANELSEEDIISIKKDAFIVKKKCTKQLFGKYINFRPKHQYSSFIQLENKLEFYYSEDRLDVKGIGDDKLKMHEEYMLNFIKKFFFQMETSTHEQVLKYMRLFIDKYKRKELPLGYYRTFDNRSYFSIINEDTVYENYYEDDIESVDISYNFSNIILKLAYIPL